MTLKCRHSGILKSQCYVCGILLRFCNLRNILLFCWYLHVTLIEYHRYWLEVHMRDILLGVIIIKMKKVNIKQVMLGTAALAGLMVTSQAVANADSMTIKSGDTVWAYSQKYHVSIDQIVKENKLGSADLIIAGQKINIPGVKTSDNSKTTTPASASSVKSTSAATSTSSQATSAVATSSSVTSASSTSEAASSSVVSSSAAVQSSTSTASESSSVASSAASVSQSSSVVSQASQSSVASTSQASNSSASQASTTNTTYTRAAATTQSTTSSSTTTNVSASSAISAAYTLVGTPYEVLDCSAFTQKAFAMAGQQIGRTTYAQATLGAHVSFSQAQAGDLVFWGSDSAPYHVAIYLGGGQYIGAHTYGDPASVKSTAYYTPSFAIHM